MEYGHPRFYELLEEEGTLYNAKSKDYAGTNPDKMGSFNRMAAIKKLYPGFPHHTNYGVAVDLMLKQFDAMMNMMAENREGTLEGIASRAKDISVYTKLIIIMYEEAQAAIQSTDAPKNNE